MCCTNTVVNLFEFSLLAYTNGDTDLYLKEHYLIVIFPVYKDS